MNLIQLLSESECYACRILVCLLLETPM